MSRLRAILHVDMDAFYASVEQRDRPELRGRPVMVGGGSARGVVAAASYEARQFGVRSAMPGALARRLCPQGIFVPARFARYREVSSEVFAIFAEYTDRVEGLSLDEAFLDVSEQLDSSEALLALGMRIKRRISREVGLTASVGMAHNKLLAKLASDYDKPDGFVHVRAEEVRRFLDPLPVRRLWGIGQRTSARLQEAGLYTIGQLRIAPFSLLQELVGNQAESLAARAEGIDDRAVKASRIRRSISQETTLDRDETELAALLALLREQAVELAESLARRDLHARTVVLKLRSRGFSTITRSQSLPGYTREASAISAVGEALLRDWAGWRAAFAVRLIGLGVAGLKQRPADDELYVPVRD